MESFLLSCQVLRYAMSCLNSSPTLVTWIILFSDQLDYHNYYKDARGYGSSTAAQNPHFQIQHHSRYINHGAQHHAGNMPRPTGQSTPMHAYHPNTHQFPYAGFSQVQCMCDFICVVWSRIWNYGLVGHSMARYSVRSGFPTNFIP